MIRDAVRRVRRSVPVLAAIILSTTVAVGVIAMPVQATGGSADEQRRVNEIINELDRLGAQIDALGEDYALAVNAQEDLAVEIASTEARIAEKRKRIGSNARRLASSSVEVVCTRRVLEHAFKHFGVH